MYRTLFILVGRNIINSSMRRWSECITPWTYMSHETSDIHINFPSPINFLHWRHWRSRISHEPWDILLTCTRAVGHSFSLFLRLHAPRWLHVLGIPPRADYALWTPRARATDLGQGPTLPAGSGRAHCMRRSREQRPGAGRETNAGGPLKHIYI